MDSDSDSFVVQHQIVGRRREQAQLRESLARTLEGRGGVVLIGGEAGIGKTTLVDDLVEQAHEAGVLVLRGGCYDLTATPPYGPWIEALRAYTPGPGQPPLPAWFGNPEEIERTGRQGALLEDARRFFSAVATLQPLLIVLEDLHWADRASLEALRYLGRYLDNSPQFIVCTYRMDEVSSDSVLVRQLPHLVRESRLHRMALQRLDLDEVGSLVASRYQLGDDDLTRLATHTWQRSSGNPFFAGEVLLGLEAERLLLQGATSWELGAIENAAVPELLRQILEIRLARLRSESRAALQVAAVIGQEAAFDLWRSVAGLEPEQLDRVIVEALDARLLDFSAVTEAVQFRHALFRESLYESLLPGRRKELHRLCGEVLQAGPNPDPDIVVHHFRLAGDSRELEWLIRAGLRARRTAAFFTAIERFERAAELLEGDDSRARERGWLLFYAVFLSRYHGELRPERQLDEAERMAAISDDRVLAATIQFHRGLRDALQGRVRSGLERFRAATRSFESLAATEYIAHVDVLAPIVMRSLLQDDAEGEETEAPALDGPLPRNMPVFARCILATWLAFGGYYREAREVGEPIVEELIEAYGESHLRSVPGASGHFALGQAYAVMGRSADARRELGWARRGYELVGDSSMADVSVWSDLLLNVLPFRADQLDERARLVSDSEELCSRNVNLSPSVELASPGVVAVNFLEGRWAIAREQAERLRASYATPMIQSGIAMLGVIECHTGESELAWQQVVALHPDGPATEPGDSYFPAASAAQRLAAELALDAGDPDLALHWIEAHARWLEWSGANLWQGEQLLLEARYHRLVGDLDAAGQVAEAAHRFAAEPRRPLLLIATHRLLGCLARENGQLDGARFQLHAACTLAASCAAPYERALTLLELAELANLSGDAADARQWVDQAREVGMSLAARPLLARIAQVEGRLPGQTDQYPDGLTAREAEVLRLVADGLSNIQIAGQLRLSSRTVERHVANIYRKIGAHNRAAATAYALSNDLI